MGRTPPRKPQESAIFGTSVVAPSGERPASPRCFRASALPTSHALIGRRHGDRDLIIELRLRRCDGGPPLEPPTNWEDSVSGATAPPETFAQVQPARFDRPTGGTAEFLGRMPSTPLAPRTEFFGKQPPRRKARRPDPLYVFGAALARQPQPQNLATPTKPRRYATRQRFAHTLSNKTKKEGRISLRALDRRGHIWVMPALSQPAHTARVFGAVRALS
jgi:hypothetical protein